jgi:quinol-cytochrome oxidoreductase complex cytochrome b subunit
MLDKAYDNNQSKHYICRFFHRKKSIREMYWRVKGKNMVKWLGTLCIALIILTAIQTLFSLYLIKQREKRLSAVFQQHSRMQELLKL